MPLGVGTLPTSLDAAAAAYAHAYQPYLSHHQVIQVRHKNKIELQLITTQLSRSQESRPSSDLFSSSVLIDII